jgi:HEAT repeat protein
MQQSHAQPVRGWHRGLVGAAAFLLGLVGPARSAPPVDIVDQIQREIGVPRTADTINPTPQFYRHREETLQNLARRLRTIGELRRALALKEWKDDARLPQDKRLQQIDLRIRTQIADEFTRAVRTIIKNGDPTARLALANLISEMGPSIRSLGDSPDRGGFARTLTNEVKQLAQDKNLAVRQEGLRALGNINADPDKVVPVFAATLEKDTQGPRRLAAEGLGQMIRVANHLRTQGKDLQVESAPGAVIVIAQKVLEAIPPGLRDPDSLVRLASIGTVQEASRTLSEVVPKSERRDRFPPAGRELTPQERNEIVLFQDTFKRELQMIQGLTAGFRAINPDLARLLRDPDQRVRQTALETVVNLAYARARLRERAASIPVLGKQPIDATLEATRAYDPLEPIVTTGWQTVADVLQKSPEPRERRAAMEFFELIEDAALPALPAMIVALQDPDRFVRWSATRAIGNLPADKVAFAAPALGKVLFDPDHNVKMAAAAALEALGPNAHDAVPAMVQALLIGDPDNRVSVMFALQAVGPENAAPAVPNLVQDLGHSDARVRRIAAHTLGRLGGYAQAAVPALRRALGDEDQEVRINASEALLNIVAVPGLNIGGRKGL